MMEEFEDMAGTTIGEKFQPSEAEAEPVEEPEALEEIADFEELRETAEIEEEVELLPGPAEAGTEADAGGDAELFPSGVDTGAAAEERFVPEEEFEEIEIDLPERPSAPAPKTPPAVGVSVEAGEGLTFLKFETLFVSPEGHAVLPAVFLDAEGNPVRLRIRVSLEEERE